MKVLVLQGSPHKKGSSNMLADEFIKGAKESGHEVQVIDVAHSHLNPCYGCDHCAEKGECVSKDDLPQIRDAILSADCLVFVTPIYYFGMSAQLKLLIDRFYSFNSQLIAKRCKSVLIAAAWGDEREAFEVIDEHYDALAEYLNFKNVGMVYGRGCGTPAMTIKTKYMKEAYELGKKLK